MQYSYLMFLCVKNIFLSLCRFWGVHEMSACKFSENILVVELKVEKL